MVSPRPAGDTVAIAAVDDEGRAVTLIQSLYQHFGAGLLEPTTGVLGLPEAKRKRAPTSQPPPSL